MNRKHFSFKQNIRKALALVLAAAALLPNTVLPAAGADENSNLGFEPATIESDTYNLVTFYEWHHVTKQSELPKNGKSHPVLILWEYGGQIYYLSGSSYEKAKYDGDDLDCEHGYKWDQSSHFLPQFWHSSYGKNSMDPVRFPDSFFTLNLPTTWTMTWNTNDKDKDNKNAAKVRFYPVPGVMLTGEDDFDYNRDSHQFWTVYTPDLGGDYSKGLTSGVNLRIFHNQSGDDVGFQIAGSEVVGWEDDTYEYSPFVMYWAETRNFSAITDNYVVGDGMVMNIDDGVMILDGVTIIVEPGGVLSIEGQLFNNGTIYNQGTVLLQPGACVSSYQPASEDSGQIVCAGGKVEGSVRINSMISLKKEAESKVITQINTTRTTYQTKTKEYQAKQTELAKYEADYRAAEDAYVAEEAEQQKLIDNAANPTEEKTEDEIKRDVAFMEKAVKAAMDAKRAELEKQYPGWKTYQTLSSEIAKLSGEVTELVTQLENLYIRDEALQNEILYWSQKAAELKASKGVVTQQGEGNLILLKTSKLVLNENETKSRLELKDGANLICNGYIVSPHAILLSDSQIMIREDGVIFGNYALRENLSMVRQLQPEFVGTPDVSIPGMAGCGDDSFPKEPKREDYPGFLGAAQYAFALANYNAAIESYTGTSTCVMCSGDYSIISKGFLKYSVNPPKETDGTVVNTTAQFRDPDTGAEITYMEDGTVITVELDGTQRIDYPPSSTHRNGYSVITYLDGRRTEIEGDITTKYLADGTYSKWKKERLIGGKCYLTNGDYVEYVRHERAGQSGVHTIYAEPYVNHVKEEYSFDDGSRVVVLDNGTETYYDSFNLKIYSMTMTKDSIQYRYDLYTDTAAFATSTTPEYMTKREYRGGDYAGAYVEFTYLYTEIMNNRYNNSLSGHKIFEKFGDVIWSAYSPNENSVDPVVARTYKLFDNYDVNLSMEKNGYNAIVLDFGEHRGVGGGEVTERAESERYALMVGGALSVSFENYLLGMPDDPTCGLGYITGVDFSNSSSRPRQQVFTAPGGVKTLYDAVYVINSGGNTYVALMMPDGYYHQEFDGKKTGDMWKIFEYKNNGSGKYTQSLYWTGRYVQNTGAVYDSRYTNINMYPYLMLIDGSSGTQFRVSPGYQIPEDIIYNIGYYKR